MSVLHVCTPFQGTRILHGIVTKIDGTEGVRPILHWMMQVEKICLASDHLNEDVMQAWNNVIVS